MTNPADKFKAKRTPPRGTPRGGTMGQGTKKKKKPVAKGYVQTKKYMSAEKAHEALIRARDRGPTARFPGMGKSIKQVRGDEELDRLVRGKLVKKKGKKRKHPDH